MDISKSGLKGKGLVMPGVEAEAKSSMNTGDPVKFAYFGERKPGPNLHKSKMELIDAQNRVTNMINNDLKGPGHLTHEHLEILGGVHDAIMHGINYLEYIDGILSSIRKGLFTDVDK